MLISGESKVNTPKDKKNAPAAESGNKRRKRTRDKLIRLDDLIPEKDVKGGHQFSSVSLTQHKPTKKENKKGPGLKPKKTKAALLPDAETQPHLSDFLIKK